MFGNLALNLSVDAGLSLVNDVMNAVSGSASSQPLSSSGGAGVGYGSSGFGGQRSFVEMLNKSIDNLSNAASAVLGGSQNQSPAVQPQPASGSSNAYGSQLNNNSDTAAPTSVSTAEQQANAGVNSGGNNNSGGSRTGNNIGGSSSNNVSSSGQTANNTVNAGTNSGKNADNGGNSSSAGNNVHGGGTKASNSSEGSSAAGTANGNSRKTSNSAGSSSKNSVKHDIGNNVGSTGSGNLADARAVYFIGNTIANIGVQPASSKKVDNAASGKGGGAGAGGTNVKSGAENQSSTADALLSNSAAAALNGLQSQTPNGRNEGSSAGNSSGKTFLSVFAENNGNKIADNAAGQNNVGSAAGQSASVKTSATADKNAATGSAQKAASVSVNAVTGNNQNILNKITENKTNAAPNPSIAPKASASVKSAVSNANTANTNTVNTANVNAKTLIKDAAVNALNLSVLSGEAKPALSAADGKNTEALSAGASKTGDSGSVSSSLFGAADSAVSASAGSVSASASGGNSGGFGLTGGGVSGLEDGTAGETSGSTAINSVMFMLRKNVQSATITLNPASLGTVKINISLSGANPALNQLNQSAVSNGSITVNMLAQNEAAKNILQSSSDSLQNALKNQGFSSINLNISTGSGYNNGSGNNGSGAFKNPFAGVNYNGGYSNGAPVQGAVSAGINNFSPRNPNALVDYFV